MAPTALSRVHSSAGYGAVDSPPSSPLLPYASRRHASEYLFKFLVLAQVFMYLEAGAVPSLLQQFTLTFRLSPQEQGLLGAIVYISISLASPWCSTLFRRFDPRQLLGVSLVINNLAVLGLACAPTAAWYSKSLLIALRGLVGLTQAFSCVYSPLWVHDYAPKAKRGTWMSYLQGAVPVGITLGYFAGSVTIWLASQGTDTATSLQNVVVALSKAALGINANTNLVDGIEDDSMRLCHGIYCWRWPFLTQFVLVLPLSILIFFVPREHIRLRSTRRRSIVIVDQDEDEDTSPGQARPSTWSNLWLLLHHRVYVFIVMGLSGLFFVVAGVQFWTTLYLETNTNDSMYEIHLSYLLVSGTGPIMGVFFGGWLIDQFVSYVHNTFYIAVFLWLMLFCGGSILPACSGIVISAAPPRLRPLASSVAYASYNLFGYAASNYIPGFIMNFIIDPSADADSDASGLGSVSSCNAACTYRIGFRIVLFWSVWAFFCLTCAAIESGRNYTATITAHYSGQSNGYGQTNGTGKQCTTTTASHQPVFKSVV
ncbi:Major Facilitator Superfamily (MFS) transporter [Phytophthora megakarya]|uniref:Major Facilitator Superfamily (MFS) transporter n=1 Tax=Phytophthora megakarya TaxID=4795 RepID=A0A225UTS3_9STRA|nr:Major Facilitator Superfamily (MFS) transporter [Phytophthora megakarya]